MLRSFFRSSFLPVPGTLTARGFIPSCLALSLLTVTPPASRAQENANPAKAPKETVDLLDILGSGQSHAQLNPQTSLSDDPGKVWHFTDGKLKISGEGLGYLRTTEAYRDYHLVMDYRWLERTHGPREEKARDGGLLLHIFGGDATLSGSWPSCIEAQLLEGGSGNIFLLAGKDEAGANHPVKATLTVKEDAKGLLMWNPSGEARTLPVENRAVTRINWKNRDSNWTDVKGYRGANDIENPPGKWNRIEVICQGDTVRVILNGELVNEATQINPTAGFIGIKSEFAAYEVRRWELHPLDTFKEEWVVEAGPN